MIDDVRIQETVFEFLTDPTKHPDVRRIDTHAASVFLEGTRALKIKRAVRFPFLDYSTLAKRKAACEEELKINRKFAPQIYQRLVAINQAQDGSLAIDGSGTPIEFAIEMTRFDEHQTLDRLASAAQLDPSLVDAIADTIATSHRMASPAPSEPWIESILGIIEANTIAFRTAARFPLPDIDELDCASRNAFHRIRAMLEARGKQGLVRRCHGDLHLANIVVIAQKPVLFDAIEFDPKIASIDVLYDLAFALMDLLHYGRNAEANALFNRYLGIAAAENLGALAALPLFMSMRAAIRSHVLLARLDRGHTEQEEVARTALAYFDLACELIRPPTPSLVAVGGLSGTGKSVLARGLAPLIMPQPGAVVLRSDVIRKQLLGVNETDRLPASAYRPEVSGKVYEHLLDQARKVIGQGHSVVLDAVFAREAERAPLLDSAHKLHARFIGVFLVADLTTRQSRLQRRENDVSDATAEVAGLQENYNIGAVDWAVIDASGPPDQTLKKCQALITDFEAAQLR